MPPPLRWNWAAPTGWGSADATRYLRLVFANEPLERLRGIGRRFQSAL